MKFSEFLISEEKDSRTSIISREEARDIIKNNCMDVAKQYFNEESRIFRGIKNKRNDFLFGETEKSIRKSRNTENFYTLLIDNSPQWSKFPKRSNSFVCSSSETTASSYGTCYLVLPFDGAKIAVCPHNDFWSSFEGVFSDDFWLPGFNEILKKFGMIFNVELEDDNIDLFKQSIQKLNDKIITSNLKKEEFFKKIPDNQEDLYKTFWKNKHDLYNFLLNFFPTTHFKLKTTKNLKIEKSREVWFSGKAVFLRFNEYDRYEGKATGIYSFLKNIVEKS